MIFASCNFVDLYAKSQIIFAIVVQSSTMLMKTKQVSTIFAEYYRNPLDSQLFIVVVRFCKKILLEFHKMAFRTIINKKGKGQKLEKIRDALELE